MTSSRDIHLFKVAQAAGSCRLEGIIVSKSSQSQMESIIKGTLDSKALKEKLMSQYRHQNSDTLAIASD